MRLFFLFTIALGLLSSCKAPSFSTANNMRLINGTVKMNDGREMTGALTVNIEPNNGSRNYITITTEGNKPEKLFLTDIRSMTVRNNLYEPKLIDMGWGSRDRLQFVKRLTKDSSRIHLYELYEQRNNTTTNRYGNSMNNVQDQYSYYITTPQHTAKQVAWNIEGKHLTPNFEDKMSDIVKDCKVLADKIRRKEKGYFYAQISLVQEKRIETMLNIIDEYNKCKSN